MLKNMRDIMQQFADRLTYRHWLIIAGTVSCVLGILVYLSLGNTEPAKVTVQPEQKNSEFHLQFQEALNRAIQAVS